MSATIKFSESPEFANEAVPKRKTLPPLVIGQFAAVPSLFAFIAVVKAPLELPVFYQLDYGQAAPDKGRPELDIGLIICEIPPG